MRPDVFGLNQKLRLTERPRILYLGGYTDGSGVSTFLNAMRSVLGGAGEAVLINGAEHRHQLAPVVAHLRLSGQVVFAPPLGANELSALYQSADLLVYSERHAQWLFGLLDVYANGLPVILADTPLSRNFVGYPTLLVDPEQPDIWPEAVREGLENGRLREKLIGRGLDFTALHIMPEVFEPWRRAIELLSGGTMRQSAR
jgi:glycosyltransferase involved in cell wall biosynthesis